MSKTLILDNDHASLWFHSTANIVHHQIKKYVYGQQLHEILDSGYELIKKHNATKWLSDDRHNGALTAEDAEWTNRDWLPRVAKAGWKYWAIIMPESVIGKMNMKKHVDECAAVGVEVKVFSDPDAGLQWLQSK